MENYSEFLFHCKRDPIESVLGAEARTVIYVLVVRGRDIVDYCWPGEVLQRKR